PLPIPASIDIAWAKGRALTEEEWAALESPRGVRARPHVLWFDESYDEANFRYESSVRAAGEASLLVVIGTTGATSLPMQVGAIAARRGVPLVVINPEPNPFVELAERSGGIYLEGTAAQYLPRLTAVLASS
ncbi:MAG: RNA polymerase subunit sigma, partial [Polyangiaceae bacterium]|nr:RNA polymerase subunit sigma [Polyangiaceae bacterium]